METQRTISNEIAGIQAIAHGGPLPRLDFPPYRSSLLRHPTKALQYADPEGCELLAPIFGASDVDPLEAHLTIQADGQPIGERITLHGRVRDGDRKSVV